MCHFQVRGKQNDSLEDGEEIRVKSKSIHYLASQFLADSSLSADVSQFDFTSSPASVSHYVVVLFEEFHKHIDFGIVFLSAQIGVIYSFY